ncbi:MAG: class A beta-lactamase-related serine hydrolase [Candidatus Omnitrophica bacterium]|nr:class A beta-lactamase-related serine hydrolase [Candidatus Omnitrophota bacterium]
MVFTVKKKLSIILIAALLSGGLYCVLRYHFYFQAAKRQQVALAAKKAAWQRLQQRLSGQIRKFKGEVGIVVKDLRTGWEIAYNKDRLFPSASLVKMPIMAACFIASEEGRINLNQEIILKNSDKFSGSGTLKEMRPGVAFTIEELTGLMIYDSDNTAANMLTSMLGVDYLNNVFNSLGLRNTNLSRRIADFYSRDRGIENYTTAQDMALLLEHIYRRSLVNRKLSEKCLKILKLQRVNDRLPKYLPVDVSVAHKTGLERTVCHDAGIMFSCKGDFLICVLTQHANSTAAASKKFIARAALQTYLYSEELL